MQAYNYSELYNKYVGEQANDALQRSYISNDSYTKITNAYDNKLYTPNYFIRIALGLLTIVAVFFSGLLLWLFSSASESAAVITLLILLALLCYATVELLVRARRYYNAGVDNILMVMLLVFVSSSFFVSASAPSGIVMSGVIMIIALWLSIRFADAFMATVFYFSFFIFVFLVYIEFGKIAKFTSPFVMMAVSTAVYFLVKKLRESQAIIYSFCLKAIALSSLVTFYASANYFVVREVSNQMFYSGFAMHNTVSPGWLFWILTLIIPPVYVLYGIIRKDLLLMRTGLGLIAATIFTVKYYYTILPVEIEMLFAGTIFIVLSYFLISYLATPKHRFTSRELYPVKEDSLNVEALIIAESFTKQPVIKGRQFYGGGSGGGGGATGEY